jgi:hypothetical protein
MWKILKKNMNFFIFYLAIVFGLVVILRLITGSALSVAFVIISGVLVFFLVIGATFTNEQYEEKNKGYMFLDTLPVTTREIVEAKFALVLLTVGVCVGFLVILFSLSSSPPEAIALARSYVLFMGAFCLILAGVNYIGIFALSFTKYLAVVGVGWISMGIVPTIILRTYQGRMDIFKETIVHFFTGIDWPVVIPSILVAYFVLMLVAARMRHLKSS